MQAFFYEPKRVFHLLNSELLCNEFAGALSLPSRKGTRLHNQTKQWIICKHSPRGHIPKQEKTIELRVQGLN